MNSNFFFFDHITLSRHRYPPLAPVPCNKKSNLPVPSKETLPLQDQLSTYYSKFLRPFLVRHVTLPDLGSSSTHKLLALPSLKSLLGGLLIPSSTPVFLSISGPVPFLRYKIRFTLLFNNLSHSSSHC